MKEILDVIHKTIYQFFDVCDDDEEVLTSDKDKLLLEVNKAICDNLEALEQEPCDNLKAVKSIINREINLLEERMSSATSEGRWVEEEKYKCAIEHLESINERIKALPSVTPKQRLCKDCRFFEHDCILAEVDGVPLVAHEICNKWGDGCKTGCKTKEDGHCFLFESREGESE